MKINNVIVLVTAFFVCSVSQAATSVPSISPPNNFSLVQDLFDQGSAPSNVIPGFYAGRCYSLPAVSHQPPVQAALLQIANINAGQGPAIPMKIGFGMGVAGANDPLNTYDKGIGWMPNGPSLLEPISLAIDQNNAMVENDSVEQNSKFLRVSGSYLVLKVETNVDASNLKAGDAYGYCYFFKRVHSDCGSGDMRDPGCRVR